MVGKKAAQLSAGLVQSLRPLAAAAGQMSRLGLVVAAVVVVAWLLSQIFNLGAEYVLKVEPYLQSCDLAHVFSVAFLQLSLSSTSGFLFLNLDYFSFEQGLRVHLCP